jgi:hypothetical protein
MIHKRQLESSGFVQFLTIPKGKNAAGKQPEAFEPQGS